MFIAYDVSIQLVSELRHVVPIIEKSDRELADQMRRAANSVALNLAEGQRSAKGNKHKHYAIAHGSANEVKARARGRVRVGLNRRGERRALGPRSAARDPVAAHASALTG